MEIKTVILLCSLAFTACQSRNKLNTDEQKLAAQITSDENEKQAAEAALKQNQSVVPDNLPPGFRFQEDRSVDPENPPEIIDIAGNLDNKRVIKLSDIGNRIKYIRLASPPDSLFIYRAHQIRFTKTKIIATSHFSTCIYSLSGEFIDIISKDEFDAPPPFPPPSFPKNVPYYAKYFSAPAYLRNIRKSPRGIKNKGISDIYDNNFSGEDIYYKYRDRENDKSYLMKYNIQKDSKTLSLPNHDETKEQIISKGEIAATLNPKSTYRYHVLDGNTKIGYQSKWNSARNGIMLLLENMNGDTLCIFSEPDRITNYDASVVRSIESGSKYFYENWFTFRPAFNDTVFRLVPPNSLLPVFIVNFGKHKITALEAIHPGYSLDDKFLIKSWVETPKDIFIRYTENRTSINNIKNKKVKFFYACYNKTVKELFHFPVDPLNYIYKIENDIDGGLPLWPEQTNTEERLYKSFEGWELKKHVKSNQFKQSEIPIEKKEKLLHLAEVVGDAETIIMIIE